MLPDGGGLTSSQARELLRTFGPNVLPEKPPPSDLSIFLSQIKNPLVYVLVFAAAATAFLKDFSDTVIIAVAIAINTSLGFFQERRASRALHALKKLVESRVRVIRNGKAVEINGSAIVPGDIVILSQGTKVPADGKIISASRFFISEAVLTGESAPVAKGERDGVFMGTVVTTGHAVMKVEKTGQGTQIGKIAFKVQEEETDTPLRRQLRRLSGQLAVLVLGLTLFVFLAGLLTGKGVSEILITSIALAVSAIPEGLLIALTVVLAIGMQRILKRNGLVRRLVSAETLGGVTTICMDKTGTLTQGQLKVAEIYGDEDEIALQMLLANDLDDPLVIAGFEWAQGGRYIRRVQELGREYPRLDSIPFSPRERFFASLNKWDRENNMLFVNGAPEFVLEWTRTTHAQKKEILENVENLTKQGKRLVGLARKKVPPAMREISDADVKKDLEWIGIISFWDPVRVGVKAALEKTTQAGINLIVVTGDYPQTAISVMEEFGITLEKGEMLLGEDLEKLSPEQLSKKISKIKLFARTSPDQKEKIVEALKKNGEVVAMMGDGVNDALALNEADIGIVVGDATDVARESADLVLLDSNFATVVGAIEEGRGIFNNIRKVLLYLLSDAFEEIIAVVGAIIAGLPLPVSAAQILWINLVSDGFPNLALTVDPKTEDIMTKKPRDPGENIVANWMKPLMLTISLAGGMVGLALFAFYFKATSDIALARSVAFAALGVNSLVYVFSVKTLKDPFWKDRVFDNKWLLAAVLAGLVLQISPFVFRPLGILLEVSVLRISHWVVIFISAALMFIMIEVSKAIFRKKLV